jgi:predicted dehydrogenase
MAEERKARLAFIGCGSFASTSLLPNIHRVPEIDLVAVCDIDRPKAERAARNFGARRIYTDMEEMMDKEELDGVFVIGPAPQQAALAPRVLRRGIPVYVEKPSANTSAEARELALIAEKHKVWGQVGFMKRFAYVYRMAKEIISRPDFGPLHIIKCKFAQGPYPQIWGIDSAKRAFLIGQLCHIFDLIRYFGGDVQAVQSFYHEVTPTQFAYVVNLIFSSGAVGQLDLNTLETKQAFRDIIEELQLVGYETHLVCEDMLNLRWQSPDDFSPAVPETGRYLHSYSPAWTGVSNTRKAFGYEDEVRHFARRCLGLVEGGPDLWDSYGSLLIGEAIYESAHNGGVVTIRPER